VALRGAKPNMLPQQSPGDWRLLSKMLLLKIAERLCNLTRKGPIDTTLDVDFRKLIKLKLNILPQLLALAREIHLLGVGL